MAEIHRLSSLVGEFPEAVVEYSDLFDLDYREGGRGSDGTIDCIGVVIEIFRRAGLSLPDPLILGRGVAEFAELFESVSDPDRLYDLVFVGGVHRHVLVIVRPGVALSAKLRSGVYTQTVPRLRLLSDVEYYRARLDRIV